MDAWDYSYDVKDLFYDRKTGTRTKVRFFGGAVPVMLAVGICSLLAAIVFTIVFIQMLLGII